MRRLAIVVVLLALSAVSCTSSSSGPRSASGGIRSPIPAKFARAVQHTAIGDLDRLDVCAALAGVRFSRPALRGQPDPIQSPGSCDLTLHGKTAASLFVNVSLDSDDTTDPEATVSGTTRRTVAGLRVLRFDSSSGSGVCEQVIGRGQVDVDIVLQPGKGVRTTQAQGCRISDVIVDRLAGATAHASFPPLQLARPSLDDLNFCAVARHTVTVVPEPGLRPQLGDTHGIHCFLSTPSVARSSVSVDVSMAIDARARIPYAAPVKIGSHRLYVVRNPRFHGFPCAYISRQGRTPSGAYEEIWVSTIGTNRVVPIAQTCAINKAEMISFLTIAGLT